mgnify:CR=1 FL=1
MYNWMISYWGCQIYLMKMCQKVKAKTIMWKYVAGVLYQHLILTLKIMLHLATEIQQWILKVQLS